MKASATVCLVILLTLAFTALTAPVAFGCAPEDDRQGRCVLPPRPKPPTATPAPTVAILIPQPPPSGLNPDAAIDADGTWHSINPQATLWFRYKYNGGLLQIWIDANGQTGLSMAVYSPAQRDLYGTPIGRGSPNKNEGHDLFWTGRDSPGGTYYARVTNDSSIPISFSVNAARKIQSVADRCAECHGYGITFEGCEDRGTAWCEGLEDEYKH